jgi:hypothetical protein
LGFAVGALRRSDETSETCDDAEDQADDHQPGARVELTVEPAAAERTDDDRQRELDANGR